MDELFIDIDRGGKFRPKEPMHFIKTYEYTENFHDKVRPLKDTLTDFVNDNFLKYNENELLLLSLIYKTLNKYIKKFRSDNKLKKNDVVFVFKGGNVLRLINNNVINYFPPSVIFLIRSYYMKFLKQSDNDFSIYLNPNLKSYDDVLDKLIFMTYKALKDIRREYISNPAYYFYFYNISKANKIILFKKLIGDLNKHKILKVNTIEIKPTYDKFIEFDENYNSMVYDILPHKCEFYNSINTALAFKSGTGGDIIFDLLRTKLNFEINGKINLSGELIDISIPNKNDHEMSKYNTNKKYYNFIKKNIKQNLDNDEYNFGYNIININYVIKDLLSILFTQRRFPWDDKKYTKRVNRLFYFILLYNLDKMRINVTNLTILKMKIKKFDTKFLRTIMKNIKKISKVKHNKNKMNEFIKTMFDNVELITIIINHLISYLKGYSLKEDIYDIEKVI
jgi:hypothetical protein